MTVTTMRRGRRIRDLIAATQQPDTPEQIAERLRHRAACEQARREREARWPVLTPENAQAAIDWQEARIRELSA